MPYALTEYTPLRYITLIGMQLSQGIHLTDVHLRQICSPHRACFSDFEKILGFWEKFPIPHRSLATTTAIQIPYL